MLNESFTPFYKVEINPLGTKIKKINLTMGHKCLLKNSANLPYIHGLKKRILSAIFRRYIGYRATSKRNSIPIIEREEYRQKISKIDEISTIYRFGTDKSIKKKKSSVKQRAK